MSLSKLFTFLCSVLAPRVASKDVDIGACNDKGRNMSRNPLYFDDLKVGDTFQTRRTLDTEQIKAFAQQFDPQPSTSTKCCARFDVRRPPASGWHTAAVTMPCS